MSTEFKENEPDRELWRGTHRGIPYEVSRHWRKGHSYNSEPERKPVYCFYIFVCVEQFPEQDWPKIWLEQTFSDFGSPIYRYGNGKGLSELDWHCGQTFYEKQGINGPFRAIKVGCDYDHIWDDERHYKPAWVAQDAIKCIDSLFVLYPSLISMNDLWKKHRSKFPGAQAAGPQPKPEDGCA